MNKIKQLRTDRGITQAELSKLSGVPLGKIQKYESGEININNAAAVTLLRLGKVLGVKIEDLLDDIPKAETINSIIQHFESEIESLVETEMDESCHMDYMKDYDSYCDFCLSNILKDDYIEYIVERFPDLVEYDVTEEIRTKIITIIKERCGSK